MPGGLPTILNSRSCRRILPIVSIAGVTTATATWNARRATSMSALIFTALRTWISMGNGPMTQPMAQCGFLMSRQVGLLIGMGAGFGKTFMGGLGSVTIPGAGRLITMAAGLMGPLVGPGIPDQFIHATTGLQPTWVSLDGVGEEASA